MISKNQLDATIPHDIINPMNKNSYSSKTLQNPDENIVFSHFILFSDHSHKLLKYCKTDVKSVLTFCL